MNWDPVLRTAVSDLEVNNEERTAHMWSIRYPTADGSDGRWSSRPRARKPCSATSPWRCIRTTSAIAHLVGKTLTLPLTGREIPVIADDYVDREFGTGASRSRRRTTSTTTQIGQRHKLAPIIILTLDAKINDNAPEKYRGLDRYDARKAVLADLEAPACWSKPRRTNCRCRVSQRSDAVIEPMLTDQWFVDLTSDVADGRTARRRKAITEPALDAVRNGEIKFVPENWINTYNHWLDNIQDWCISRQLWWGHRIPAWYDEAGNIFVGEDEADARAHADTAPVGALRQDDDVLDTWFSSALWPFSTLGWPAIRRQNERGEWSRLRRQLPAERGAGHRLRHHLLLGRADGHDDLVLHRRRCRSARSTSTRSCATRKARRCPSPRATRSTRWT